MSRARAPMRLALLVWGTTGIAGLVPAVAAGVVAGCTATDFRPGGRDSSNEARSDSHEGRGINPDRNAPSGVDAALPLPPGPFAPSRLEIEGEADVDLLADVARCARCHAAVVESWQGGAHANASFSNPFYRVAVTSFRENAGREKSRFCSGCHEPAFLIAGKADEELDPDAALSHAGITCLVCHSTVATTSDGNASFTLRIDPPLEPDPADPEQVARHRARMRPRALGTAEQCGSCHRSFLDGYTGHSAHLNGVDDLGDFRSSVFGGSTADRVDDAIPEETCVSCHMRPFEATKMDMAATNGFVLGHDVVGSHTALATDPKPRTRIRERLTEVVSVDVPAVIVNGTWHDARSLASLSGSSDQRGPVIRGGDSIELLVSVRNEQVGHRFPGGARDLGDAWLEVTLKDARGRVVGASRGRKAHRFTAHLLDEESGVERIHRVERFRALLRDHSIRPRDVAIVRYTADVPVEATLPLTVEAKVLHRQHGREMRQAACAAVKSPLGQRFRTAAARYGRTTVDPCVDMPTVQITSSAVTLGAEHAKAASPEWRRLYLLALGLRHERQEHREDAGRIAEAALRAVNDDGTATARDRAMVHAVAADIAALVGRVKDALRHAAIAESIIGEHAALERIRGDVYSFAFSWEKASGHYARARELAPSHSDAHRKAARALGSLGRNEEALAAAIAGLALVPEDEELLRTQWLALEALGPDEAGAATAFADHRKPDDGNDLFARCRERTANCATYSDPVPVLPLTPD